MEPGGKIVFNSVGRPSYCFDIFSVDLNNGTLSEHRLTDGVSINFNGQFVDEQKTLLYISERTASARIFLNRAGTGSSDPQQLHSPPKSLSHDRPLINNGLLFFISAHQRPQKPFTSWSALYSTMLDNNTTADWVTPHGSY